MTTPEYTDGTPTTLRLWKGEPWPLTPQGRTRRIGWLDQRGRVWVEVPPVSVAEVLGSGSFTPLLIQIGADD